METVFLSLCHTRIAGQESSSLESGAEFLIGFDQGSGNPQPDGSGLPGHPTTSYPADDVKTSGAVRQLHGLQNDKPAGLIGKEIIEIPFIDRYITAAGD